MIRFLMIFLTLEKTKCKINGDDVKEVPRTITKLRT